MLHDLQSVPHRSCASDQKSPCQYFMPKSALCHPHKRKISGMTSKYRKGLGLQGDVQALSCHLKDDHHHLGSKSSDVHQNSVKASLGPLRTSSTSPTVNIKGSTFQLLGVPRVSSIMKSPQIAQFYFQGRKCCNNKVNLSLCTG